MSRFLGSLAIANHFGHIRSIRGSTHKFGKERCSNKGGNVGIKKGSTRKNLAARDLTIDQKTEKGTPSTRIGTRTSATSNINQKDSEDFMNARCYMLGHQCNQTRKSEEKRYMKALSLHELAAFESKEQRFRQIPTFFEVFSVALVVFQRALWILLLFFSLWVGVEL